MSQLQPLYFSAMTRTGAALHARLRLACTYAKQAVASLLIILGLLVHPCTAPAQQAAANLVPGSFVDIAEASSVHFQHMASHTSMRYSLEMMGSGVVLFDYDNDGRLDIFCVNGAEIKDPNPKRSRAAEDQF